LPATPPEALGGSSSVRTIVVTSSAPPGASKVEGEAVARERRVTPATVVTAQRASTPAPPPALASFGNASPAAPLDGSDSYARDPEFARSRLAGSEARSSALVVSLATQVAHTPGRPAASSELTRHGRRVAPSDLAPAQVEVAQSVGPGKGDSHLPLLQKEDDKRSAAFRALRRRLAEQSNPAVVLVTSAQDGEGKTTCAANLALAMAESGRHRVLLLEANLRRPKLAEIFGFEPTRCLIAQLAAHRGQVDAPWLTAEIQPSGLHVLAVSPGADREQSLHGPSFSTAVDRWRLAFDYVVIDGPAVLSNCDASIIQDTVDAVVMVARSGVTRNRTVKRALEQISANLIAGLVLMDSRWAH
jgi:Mrp family chromosome partitioning ATPase